MAFTYHSPAGGVTVEKIRCDTAVFDRIFLPVNVLAVILWAKTGKLGCELCVLLDLSKAASNP